MNTITKVAIAAFVAAPIIVYTVKKGRDKVATLLLSPASDKGRSTLRQGENMWLYIPNVGKPVRITSLQSVTGGIFNNADIMRVSPFGVFFPNGFSKSFPIIITPPRGPRRVLCVVVVTTSAYPKGEGCSPAATSPAMWAISTIR